MLLSCVSRQGIDAGAVDHYRDLTPNLVGSYWVIRDADTFLAYENRDPRSGCTLRWLTPEDAYRCFMRSEIDVLVLEDCILEKGAQPRAASDDAWMKEFELD